jgi:DHA1 family bicyclomycin/chloramphenicol resistance-like MFS transporter
MDDRTKPPVDGVSAAALPPGRARVWMLGAVISMTAVSHASQQVFLPAIPVSAAEFETSLGLTQVATSVSMACMAVAMLFYGPLSDKYGRRPVLFVGATGFLLGSIVAAIATSIEVLLLGRLLQAVGGAAGFVVGRAIVRDIYGPENSARVLGTLTLVMVGAPMVAVILGGALTDFVGWRAVFGLTFLAGLGAAVALWLFVPAGLRGTLASPSVATLVRGYARLLRSPAFIGFAGQGAVSVGAFMAFMGTAPFLMHDVLGRPAIEFGVYFALVTLVFMLANFVGGRLSIPIGLERMVALGGLVSTLGVLLCMAWFGLDGLGVAVLFMASTLASIGNGLAMPNSQAGALNVIPELAGTASGGAAFLQTMFGAVFLQVVASLTGESAWPLFGAMLTSAVLSLTFGLIPLLLRWRASN